MASAEAARPIGSASFARCNAAAPDLSQRRSVTPLVRSALALQFANPDNVRVPTESNGAKRFPTRTYCVVLGLIALVAVSPLISVLVASGIAESAGCRLDEGGAHPCLIGGADWGEALSTMFVLGWLMFATLPFGGVAFLVWLAAFVTHRIRWRNRQRAVAI